MRGLPLALATAAVCIAIPAQAQGTVERAAFITTLGNDTIAVERIVRSDARLEGHLVTRSPSTRIAHYVATLQPDGGIGKIEIRMYPPGTDPDSGQYAVMTLTGDSAITKIGRSDSIRTIANVRKTYAIPLLPTSYGLLEQLLIQAHKSGKDSVDGEFHWVGNRQAFGTHVVRHGGGKAVMSFFGDPLVLRTDASGRLLAADGSATTFKVDVKRLPDIDVDVMAQKFLAAEQTKGRFGVYSPRDTASGKIGGATVMVDYSRPSKRGRAIMGAVVPYDKVWRTGANAATQLWTDADIEIGGTTVPAGKYTLWTIPSKKGVTLIINKQTGQWGTEYDASQDFARIALKEKKLSAPVEQFEIVVEGKEAGKGVLRFSWDRTAWEVELREKKG